MAATKITDIIIPDVFNPYVVERTAELSNLVKSGIIIPDSALDKLALAGGKLINMPFYNDLTGNDEVLSDSGSLTPGAIGALQDIAVLNMRGRAWGVNDLAKALAGDDPMRVIGDLVAEYWARRQQALLISILKGVFADNVNNDSGDHVYDISSETGANPADGLCISAEAVITAAAKMGDAMQILTAICMHSVPYAKLQKLNLIDFTPTNVQDIGFGTYLGKTVIVDDGCPAIAGDVSGYEYWTYLFGRGAIGYGEGAAPVPTETDRDSLAGEDYLINRRHFILHPRGIAFQSSAIAGASPTNSEFEEAAQWNRVYESKNIRIVALVTNG